MGYSLDLKGSEYYSIYLRNLKTKKDFNNPIENTNGNITFSYDSKYLFYTKLDKNHRSKEIYLHKINSKTKALSLYIRKELIDFQ